MKLFKNPETLEPRENELFWSESNIIKYREIICLIFNSIKMSNQLWYSMIWIREYTDTFKDIIIIDIISNLIKDKASTKWRKALLLKKPWSMRGKRFKDIILINF